MRGVVQPIDRKMRWLILLGISLFLVFPTLAQAAQTAQTAQTAPAAPAAPASQTAQPSSRQWDLSKIQVLDLDTAVRITLSENLTLAAARARVQQAAEQVKQARSSYWPSLDLSAGGSWVDLSQGEVDAQEGSLLFMNYLNTLLQEQFNAGFPVDFPTSIPDPEYYYSVGLKATWVVFSGFARKFSAAAARYGEQASVLAHEDARRSLLSLVIFAYLNAQQAKENNAIAQADAAFNNRLLTEARLRYDVGAGALSDVLNFQVNGNAAQTQIIQFDLVYQNALIGLAALMGAPQGRLPEHIRLAELEPTTAMELASLNAAALIKAAMDQRPDIQQLQTSIKAMEVGVKLAKSGYYPAVVLSAGVEGQRAEDPVFEEDDFGSSIALGLSWNLFSGGLTRAQVGEAKAKLYELQRTLESARIGVAQEVQSIVAQIRSVQQQLALQETSTELVQQQRDLVEKEYKSGVGSLVRLNQAQRELTVAQGRLVQTRVALRQAWYSLQDKTGQILELFQAQ